MNMTIGVIGGGNMGGAIVGGICKEYRIVVCEQDAKRRQVLKKKYKVKFGDLSDVIDQSNVLMLAVKPQNFDDLLTKIKPLLSKKTLVISIAAGITCRYIEKRLGSHARVVRAMPNLPVQVGEGMTGVCLGKNATNRDLVTACRLFSLVGKTVVVLEKQIDAVTAVSGSGPAYLFYVMECLQKTARSLGLDDELGKTLVRQTIRGSLDLLDYQKEEAGVLRERVTSKGGTTEAALKVFKKRNMGKIFKEALTDAKRRAKALSK